MSAIPDDSPEACVNPAGKKVGLRGVWKPMTDEEFMTAFRDDPVTALRLQGLFAVADDVERELASVSAALDRLARHAVPAAATCTAPRAE